MYESQVGACPHSLRERRTYPDSVASFTRCFMFHIEICHACFGTAHYMLGFCRKLGLAALIELVAKPYWESTVRAFFLKVQLPKSMAMRGPKTMGSRADFRKSGLALRPALMRLSLVPSAGLGPGFTCCKARSVDPQKTLTHQRRAMGFLLPHEFHDEIQASVRITAARFWFSDRPGTWSSQTAMPQDTASTAHKTSLARTRKSCSLAGVRYNSKDS